MSDQNISIAALLKDTISELVDYDATSIKDDTKIEDLNLVSLDYVTIMVSFKKELGIDVDLDSMKKADLHTFKDLVNFVGASPVVESSPA